MLQLFRRDGPRRRAPDRPGTDRASPSGLAILIERGRLEPVEIEQVLARRRDPAAVAGGPERDGPALGL
jgi:hypothetical protein